MRVILAVLFVVACKSDSDDAAKKEADRLRSELESLKAERAEKAKAEADAAKQEAERLRSELKVATARAEKAEKTARTQGRLVVDETAELKEGGSRDWTVPSGRYRIRVTASNSGVKVKWIGAECAAKGETKLYEAECELATQAHIIVENPKGLTGLGPSETVSITATTM